MEQNKQIQTKTGLGTASLTLGIIGLVFAFIPFFGYTSFLLGLLALVFGCVGAAKYLKKGTSIAGIILGIFAIIIAVIMQFTVYNVVKSAVKDVAKAVDSVSSTVADAEDDIDMLSGENTDKILDKYVDVSIGKFKAEESKYLSKTSLPVTVKNKSKARKSFYIQIEAVDKSGNRITDDTVYVNDLNAGQSQEKEAFVLVENKDLKKLKKAKFKIVEVSMY